MSFIPKNTNKTQKRSHFLDEIAITIAIGAISIGEVPVTGEIAIVVRRCGSFRLARFVGRSSQALREVVHV